MKKLFMVLAVASMFIASTAFGANYNCASQYIAPATFGGFDFDMTYDLNAMTMSVGVTQNSTAASLAQGEWSTAFSFAIVNNGGILESTPNATDYATAVGSAALTSFVGYIMGAAYNLPIFNWNHDIAANSGSFAMAPYWSPTHIPAPEGVGGFFYTANIPIPGAAWLLITGLVGIIALRRRS